MRRHSVCISLHTHTHTHRGLHRSVKWEGSPRGVCWSKLALYVSLSALNTNMQQYNWIIGAIISVTVSCASCSEQTHYSKAERLWILIKTYKNTWGNVTHQLQSSHNFQSVNITFQWIPTLIPVSNIPSNKPYPQKMSAKEANYIRFEGYWIAPGWQ